ncbi:MAG: hypothetical protein J5806_11975 [Lentisphaeria bacterium]|nr:hypothetical protein [Lentisphaeria bacterium]
MQMKRIMFGRGAWCGILLVFLTLAGTGCACCTAPAPKTAAAPAKAPLKVGLYVDAGSQGGGVIQLARLIEYSPQLQLILLEGQDLRDGKLKGLDLLVVPGGSSGKQYESMQETGVQAVRDYVAGGGAYFGICAGFHCTLNRPKRIGLLPYTFVQEQVGSRAVVTVDISKKGAQLLDIRPGAYSVVYSHGPISRPCEQPGTGWGEVLAVYKNSISSAKRPKANFAGYPAMLHGQYGKGKVIATSFHPEYRVATHEIAFGCIYAVTGVKPAPVFPVKQVRPLRVGYNTVLDGKTSIAEALMLDRQPDLDVNFAVSFPDGSLDHLDVMVFPQGRSKATASAVKAPPVMEFLKRGGKVIAIGKAAEAAPDHPNVIRLSDRSKLLETVRAAGKK